MASSLAVPMSFGTFCIRVILSEERSDESKDRYCRMQSRADMPTAAPSGEIGKGKPARES
jgi:hypothetical protein